MRRAPPGPRRTRGRQAPPARPSLPRRTPASRGTPSCTQGWPPHSRARTPVGAQDIEAVVDVRRRAVAAAPRTQAVGRDVVAHDQPDDAVARGDPLDGPQVPRTTAGS